MSNLKSLFNKVNDALAKVEVVLIVIFMALLVLIMVAQVALRYLFHSPLFWAEEISLQLLIVITFFGVSYLTYKKNLLQVDLLQHYLSVGMKKILAFILLVLNFLLLTFLAYLYLNWVTDPMVQADISGTTGLPRWYNYGVAAAAICFMAFHQFINVFNVIFGQPEQSSKDVGGLI
ncbi:MAG: TRAP transporter small permease subunit [Alcaligenaceae bacterium]|nr:TRAP transporter small permease subunit [Alcaligenaceae bacterium]